MPESLPVYVEYKEIKKSVSIVQVLDRYGLSEKLRTRGDSISGCCPLHNGTNPSHFRVSVKKNAWNCFGSCGRGGNVIDFVSLKEGVEFHDAAVLLVEWFDLKHLIQEPRKRADKPVRGKSQDKAREPDKEPDGSVLSNKPLSFTLNKLEQEHPYLDERGLTPETIREFGFGYCSEGSMSGRVVVPITNLDGDVLAYAGRWPGDPPEDKPKWKLPAGFLESLEVFGLGRAMQEDRSLPLVLVEGFFDCAILWQRGYRKVAALMGTSLSEAQEVLIQQCVHERSRIVVLFDEDDAGRKGRIEVAGRLANHCFVTSPSLESEGQQAEEVPDGVIEEVYQ